MSQYDYTTLWILVRIILRGGLWGNEFVVGASGGRTQKEGVWGIILWSDVKYKKGEHI
jgi:hypothetical protein